MSSIQVPPCIAGEYIYSEIPGVGKTVVGGKTKPADTSPSYAPGCIFIHIDGGVGTAVYINEGTAASCTFNALTNLAAAAAEDVTVADAGTYTDETDVEGALQELYSFVTPMLDNTALTADLTTITPASAPGSPDFAIADPVEEGGAGNFGFSTADEFKTVMAVLVNLQTRVAELETALIAAGILQAP